MKSQRVTHGTVRYDKVLSFEQEGASGLANIDVPDTVWANVYGWADEETFVKMQNVSQKDRHLPSLRQIQNRLKSTFGDKPFGVPAFPTDKSELLAFCNERLRVTSGLARYVKKHGGEFTIEGQYVRDAKWLSWGSYCVVELEDSTRRLVRFSFDGEVELVRGGPQDDAIDVGCYWAQRDFVALLKMHSVEIYTSGESVRTVSLPRDNSDGSLVKAWFSAKRRFLFVMNSMDTHVVFDLLPRIPKKVQFPAAVNMKHSLSVSGDEQYLFMAGDHQQPASLWYVADGPQLVEEFRSSQGPITAACLSKTGRFLALYNGATYCGIAERQGDRLRGVEGSDAYPFLSECEQAIFTKDERFVFFRPRAQSQTVQAGLVFALEPQQDGQTTMRLLHHDVFEETPIIDDRYVVIGYQDRPRLWDMQQRKTAVAMGDGIQMGHGCLSRVRQVPGGRYLSFTVAVPPDDGSFVSAAPEQSCRLEAHLVDLRDPHSNPVVLRDPDPCLQGEGAFYSPDGRCAVVTMWNGMARIWDLTEQPKPVGLLRNLGTGPCAFSDDGRFFMTLANSTEAKTSRIWDLKEFLSYF